jgi:hypothetical protein
LRDGLGFYQAIGTTIAQNEQTRRPRPAAFRSDPFGKTARRTPRLPARLPSNERVRRFLTRFVFGGEANAFRHGRLDPIGPRHQRHVWLVALAAWIAGWGWPRPT